MATIDDREYWDARKVRLDAEAAAAAEYRQSLAGRIRLAERKLNALYADRDAHTEAEIAEAQARLDALYKEREAAK